MPKATYAQIVNINSQRTKTFQAQEPTEVDGKLLQGVCDLIKWNKESIIDESLDPYNETPPTRSFKGLKEGRTASQPDTLTLAGGNFRNVIWNTYMQAVCGMYIFEGLPDDITSSDINYRLLYDGSTAVVKTSYQGEDTFIISPYDAEDTDYWDRPTKIKLTHDKLSQQIRNHIWTKDQFSILHNTKLNQSLWNMIYPFIAQLETSYFICSRLTNANQQKFILFNKGLTNSGGVKPLQTQINNFFADPTLTVLVLDISSQSQVQQMLMNENAINPMMAEKDTPVNLAITSYKHWDSMIRTILGLVSNVTANKKEQTTASDTNAEQSLNEAVKYGKLFLLEDDLERLNKKFGTNWTIRINEKMEVVQNNSDESQATDDGGDPTKNGTKK